MARVQLALNVVDIEAAVAFYSKLFGTEPAKRQPGYANFAIADPPLKLVLIEDKTRSEGIAGALNHLGVEVDSSDEVTATAARLAGQDLDTLLQENTSCCYAVQDKVWVNDPDGAPWEYYTVLADSSQAARLMIEDVSGGGCCAPASQITESGATVSACC
jgi:catechol 2,3-dioxygenase-like lactoylglutathione lyase family enzyme